MNFEKSVKLYKEFLEQQRELRRVGLEINGVNDAEKIKQALEEAYLNETDRFERIKIKQRIEETDHTGAGLSDYSESILQKNDIQSTALELKNVFIAEEKAAKGRHTELNKQLNQKINAKSKELDQMLKKFKAEVKPITDEIDLISKRGEFLTSTFGRKENAIDVMKRFGGSEITHSTVGSLPESPNVKKTLLSKIVSYTRQDLWKYFKGGKF